MSVSSRFLRVSSLLPLTTQNAAVLWYHGAWALKKAQAPAWARRTVSNSQRFRERKLTARAEGVVKG